MAKKQDVKIDDLVTIKPITDNQKVAFEAFKKDNKELFLHGMLLVLERLLFLCTLHLKKY